MRTQCRTAGPGRRCTRGGGMTGGWVGSRRGYTGTHPGQSQGPIFNIFQAQGPTYGQMKAFQLIYEVSQIGY